MRTAMIISTVSVVFITAAVLLVWYPVADPPTSATAPEKLTIAEFDENFPRLYQVTNPDDDALTHYDAASAVYRANRDSMSRPTADHIARITGHLIAGMQAGRIADGFLDKTTTLSVGTGSNSSDLPAVAAVITEHLNQRAMEDQLEPGDAELARAVFALGERMFRRNLLLSNRMLGLELMSDGAGILGALEMKADGRTSDKLNAAADQLTTVLDRWASKMTIVMSPKPHVGDLLNIAANDQDMTWRIAATGRLGVAKFTSGSRGNRAAIRDHLAIARTAEPPLLARAATLADELTVDQFHSLR